MAAELLLSGEFGPDARVVQGLPRYRGGEERYWHAWLEHGDPARAVDRSGGKDLSVPAVWYRQLGDVEVVWEFGPGEVLDELERWGHWGPWVPGWERYDAL